MSTVSLVLGLVFLGAIIDSSHTFLLVGGAQNEIHCIDIRAVHLPMKFIAIIDYLCCYALKTLY